MSKNNSGQSKISVLWVDDSPEILDLYRALINDEPDFEYVGSLESADHVLAEARRLKPAVIVLDFIMPGAEPLHTIAEIVAAGLPSQVVLFTGYDDEAVVKAARDAGAAGVVSKNKSPTFVLETIRKIVAGQKFFGPTAADCR